MKLLSCLDILDLIRFCLLTLSILLSLSLSNHFFCSFPLPHFSLFLWKEVKAQGKEPKLRSLTT